MHIRLGTRGSRLALMQTSWVKQRLQDAYPQHTFDVVVIKTKGDQILDKPLDAFQDKGIFVTEIEKQILDGVIDIGVHSMKDMPVVPMEGLKFTKIWKREDARDVLILRNGGNFDELPLNARIATGSKRRSVQLLRMRPDIKIEGIRGNVETRLQKMKDQNLDGIVMAAAGFHRLQLNHLISAYFDVKDMVPACAQGALALEIDTDRLELASLLDALSDPSDTICVEAERLFLKEVEGGCHIAVGALCESIETGYRMIAMMGNEDNTAMVQEVMEGPCANTLAVLLANKLKDKINHAC